MRKIRIETLPVKNKKKKIKWEEVFITVFAIVLLGGAMIWIVARIYQQAKADLVAMERPVAGIVLDHKIVCMASNVYMGEEQLAVSIHGKTYYTCSNQCTSDINKDENARLATDPISKHLVDKSQAFISINRDNVRTILYFESEENLRKYLKK